ncbi:hypothetical protein [Roseobacter ponti]|uniref:Lipoprotein n=1 Tax=Roseobacter ponti TaxID=1891787 RepID=A0A858SVQ2_9RHOB|nr:hypothetical protein [Roseobacter ponti]QJF51561.1 hypothetical protein G3256_10490 [Roseobacter ponti]
MRFFIPVLAMTGLLACTELPDIDDGITAADEAAEYPDLIALSPAVLEQAREEDETSAALDARAAGLRTRAAGLRPPVLTETERARLGATVP